MSAPLFDSFTFSEVTICECVRNIKKLKRSSTPIDSVPPRILKLVKCELASVISILINASFRQGQFPIPFKTAHITPIFKDGDRTNISNYRPISILPTMSKLFERAVADRLVAFLDKHNVLSSSQYGFQKHKSTEHALINLTEFIYASINNRKHAVAIFLDFRKAFDTVNHSILLDKLSVYGIRGIEREWFASYLGDREQRVKIGNSLSSAKQTNIGIPQGSILGPLLFLLYINDLPNVSPFMSTILFADDTTLLAAHDDIDSLIHQINIELCKFSKWLNINRLSLNVDKTYYMIFTTRTIVNNISLYFNNNKIKTANYVKYLGVRMDSGLTFEHHVAHILNKVSKTIGIFYKIRNYVSLNKLISV